MLADAFEAGDSAMIRFVLLTTALAAALIVSGCGRKGPLEPPNAKVPEATEETTPAPVTTLPVPKSAKPKSQPKTEPSSPFLLDPLL